MFSISVRWVMGALAAGLPLHAAQFVTETNQNAPLVAAASNEGELALKRLRLPKGFKAELFAAEPLLANPVAFTIDEKGRFYVAETFRLHAGVTDIRGHMSWLDEELASTTVEERVAIMTRHEGRRIADYAKFEDRVKLVWDSDHDGKADKSTVFAGGFNGVADGLGAGLLARKGTVYYTCIPNLWMLRDKDGDGIADQKKSLLYGFGVRVGFLGHDLHGLRMGPDGKLYFSIGDRGAHVVARELGVNEKLVSNPEEGVVYRCNLDGSELEIFARGLRNPQELVFDAYGNLWTGDNNSDGGDPARWVYVVEGGDSGWRVGFQFINSPNARGVWNSDRLCYPQFPGQAAYLLPPLANIGNGPSGLAYSPGIGLPERYAHHFFLCDFRGSTGSGIHSFGVKPKGAGFEVTDRHEFLWELLATDGDFGYDGSFYVSDWVQGWNKTGKGRIYRLYDPEQVKKKSVRETKELFARGFEKLIPNRLADLLEHPDTRVRQEAQFAIVDLGPVAASKLFTNVLQRSHNQFARLHGIWGLGQIAARSQVAAHSLTGLLTDGDAEVRAQALRMLGDSRSGKPEFVVPMLKDPEPRVRYFAGMALSKIAPLDALPEVLDLLRENDNRDVYLRHAGVMAVKAILERGNHDTVATLTGFVPSPAALEVRRQLDEAMHDKSDAVRMALLLALRRVESPDVARFLEDSSPAVVAEAARAIHDLPIVAALPKLAALIEREDQLTAYPVGDDKQPGPRDSLIRRVINANYRLGGANNAVALAGFAATGKAPEKFRVEALSLLGDWEKPSGRDRLTGLWRPIEPRSPQLAAAALQPHLAALQKTGSNPIKLAATKVSGVLGLQSEVNPLDTVKDPSAASNVRVETLRSMVASKHPQVAEAIVAALADKDEPLRKEATRLQAQTQPAGALGQLRATLEKGSLGEQQSAFATLATLPPGEADKILAEWLGKLMAGQVKAEVTLDLLDAAGKREAAEVRARLREYESKRPAADDLRSYRECLTGGDAEEGRKVFQEKAEASCVRCHKWNGEGGEVGPELTALAAAKGRNYILESIIYPNKQIAQGFESVTVLLKNGTAYAGILKKETADSLEINSPEDGLLTVKKADIKTREKGLSGMPEELRQVLTKQDIRNLVEFLSSSAKPTAK